jgi:hypothetical protein
MKLCVQLGAHGVLSPWQKAGRERAFASIEISPWRWRCCGCGALKFARTSSLPETLQTIQRVMKLCVQLGAHGVLSPWQKAGRERAFASLVYASDTQPHNLDVASESGLETGQRGHQAGQ